MASAVTSAARKLPSSRKQHDDDQHRALGQVLLDGPDGRVDELGAVEHGLGDDVRRQGSRDDLSSSHPRRAATVRLLAPISISAVPTTTSSPVLAGRAGAQLTADADLSHVLEIDRHAVACVASTTLPISSALSSRAVRAHDIGFAACARCSRRRCQTLFRSSALMTSPNVKP